MKNKKTYPDATRLQFLSTFYEKTTIHSNHVNMPGNTNEFVNSTLVLDHVFHDLKIREQHHRNALQLEAKLYAIASTMKISESVPFQIDSLCGHVYSTDIPSGADCLKLKRNFFTTVQEVRSILINKELLKLKELHVDDFTFEEAVYVLSTFCCDDTIFKMDYPILIFYKIPQVLYPGCLWAFRDIKNTAGIFDLPWHVQYEIPIPLVITKENMAKQVDE